MSKFVNHLKTILPNHYVPRRRASAIEDINRGMIPAHWSGIVSLAGVFVDLTQQESESDNGYQGTQHREPQWSCVKSVCQEGGLMAFKELTKSTLPDAAGGSLGSLGSPTTEKVAAPPKSTVNQAFHQNGSGGSGGSDRGGVSFKNQIEFEATATTNLKNGLPPHPPVADPPALPDPEAETLDFAYPKTDQAQKLMTDPSEVADPNSSAQQSAPTPAATKRWENFRWESGKRVWFEGQQWRIVIVNHYGNKEVSLKPVDADINYPPRYVPMGDLIANGEPAT